MYPESTVHTPTDARVHAVGVDWLTATASTGERGDLLWQVGQRLLVQSQSEGEFPTRWHAHGYEGWSVPHVALGARGDGTYLRLSGHKCRDQWKEAVGAAEHRTRTDLAVDVHLAPPMPLFTRERYSDALHKPSKGGRPTKKSLTINSDGGSTLYIGSRTSEGFGRLYDKGRETGTLPAGQWWRWELEAKQGLAEWVVDQLRASEEPEKRMLSIVSQWFTERGARGLPAYSDAAFYKGNREMSTAEQQLQWLATGVRPTVARLVSKLGAERVAAALGLTLSRAVREPIPAVAPLGEEPCQQPDRSTR